jgi:hypothetical protein
VLYSLGRDGTAREDLLSSDLKPLHPRMAFDAYLVENNTTFHSLSDEGSKLNFKIQSDCLKNFIQ